MPSQTRWLTALINEQYSTLFLYHCTIYRQVKGHMTLQLFFLLIFRLENDCPDHRFVQNRHIDHPILYHIEKVGADTRMIILEPQLTFCCWTVFACFEPSWAWTFLPHNLPVPVWMVPLYAELTIKLEPVLKNWAKSSNWIRSSGYQLQTDRNGVGIILN